MDIASQLVLQGFNIDQCNGPGIVIDPDYWLPGVMDKKSRNQARLNRIQTNGLGTYLKLINVNITNNAGEGIAVLEKNMSLTSQERLTLEAESCQISGNFGHGMKFVNPVVLRMSNCTISNNQGMGLESYIYFKSRQPNQFLENDITISKSRISKNFSRQQSHL